MRPIPAPRIGDSHGILRAIEERGRLRTDELVTEFPLEQLFPPELENAVGRMRHFISYARSAGLVKEDRGVVELTDVGKRYVRAGDSGAPFDVSAQQAEWLRRQLREKHMTDSIFHGMAIGLSLLASAPPGSRVSTLDFGRALAYLGRAGWDNENTFQIQGERYLTLLTDVELIDAESRLTGTGEQVRGELTLPVHMSLLDIAAQLNPGGADAVRADAATEHAPQEAETPSETGYHDVVPGSYAPSASNGEGALPAGGAEAAAAPGEDAGTASSGPPVPPADIWETAAPDDATKAIPAAPPPVVPRAAEPEVAKPPAPAESEPLAIDTPTVISPGAAAPGYAGAEAAGYAGAEAAEYAGAEAAEYAGAEAAEQSVAAGGETAAEAGAPAAGDVAPGAGAAGDVPPAAAGGEAAPASVPPPGDVAARPSAPPPGDMAARPSMPPPGDVAAFRDAAERAGAAAAADVAALGAAGVPAGRDVAAFGGAAPAAGDVAALGAAAGDVAALGAAAPDVAALGGAARDAAAVGGPAAGGFAPPGGDIAALGRAALAGDLRADASAFVDPAAIRAAAEGAGLRFPDSVYANLAAALAGGKHVLLTGAPGSGKTSLALAAARAAAQAGRANGATLVTASRDWDDRAVLVESAKQARWVIFDELDRIDLDQALGELSSFLAGLPVRLAGGEEAAPEGGWRIVATAARAPRGEAALLRRFAVVEVLPPSEPMLAAAINAAARGDATAAAAAARLVPLATLAPLGAGVFIDAARHAAARNAAAPAAEEALARDAYAAYVAPLLGELDHDGARRVREILGE